MLTPAQIQQFKHLGYLVLREFSSPHYCDSVVALANRDLSRQAIPIEYEADVDYPGAPASRTAEGGNTARRLLGAAQRDPLLLEWATASTLKDILQQLLGSSVFLSQAHHNCIMTKQPAFSSTTNWHRDSRYWRFTRPELVSAWLALGNERPENGCLWVIPSSHLWEIDAVQLDENQFLRADYAQNRELLKQAIPIELKQGDLLLFHSNLFHAAGRNITENTKYALVFTYRAGDNPPIAGTRSASVAEIALHSL